MLVYDMLKTGKDERTALIYKGENITYKEFRKRVDLLRQYLYKNGVKKGDRIGLFYKNSAEFVYSYMAVVSLGAIVVPFNIMLTARELSFMIENAEISLIITMQKLDAETEQLILPDKYSEIFDGEINTNIKIENLNEDDECVIIYTSGTTGEPKGATLTHKNLSENCMSVCEVISMTEDERSLAVLPMFHSFSWTTMVLSLIMRGATVSIMEMFVPNDALKNIAENKLSFICGVPAMYNFYLVAGNKELFESVRVFVCGGAALPIEVLNQFESKYGIRIMEGYGLSEASPVVSFNPMGKGKPGSVGKPLNRIEVKIVDEKGEEVPTGTIGEITVKGTNVMKGYWKLPGVTAKTIINGWLHTGDLGFVDKEGYIYIVDRLKDMIIVSGLNVYSREVEEELYKYPDVAEAAVVGAPDEKRGEVVCAFVALKEGKELNRKEILSFLKERLASYKIPRHIYQLDVLPKNGSGKIAKKVLKDRLTNKQ